MNFSVKVICGCRLTAVSILSALMLFAAACSDESGSEKSAEQSESGLVPVTLRLKWLRNVSAAGSIWAERAGFFSRAGMSVAVREGGSGHDAITDIELGRAQFGIASADQVIRAVSKGARIRVLAQIFQKNPLQWIYIRGVTPDITAPSRLAGLTVGITFGGNDEAVFTALMRRFGLRPGLDVYIYGVHYDYAPFWRHEVNLWPVYRNTEGIVLQKRLRQRGSQAAFFDPEKYGIDFPANSLITSEEICGKRPEFAEMFRQVLLQAWTDALLENNIHAVAAAINTIDPDARVAVLEEQLRATRPLVLDRGVCSGRINVEAWKRTASTMLEQGLVEQRVDIKAVLAPCAMQR